MPEGDTLRRAAEVLTPVLEGQIVTDLWFKKLRGYRPRVGDTIHSVEAVGKYLLLEFDRKLVLHTHLGMTGSWRVTTLDRAHPRRPKASNSHRDSSRSCPLLRRTGHLDSYLRVRHRSSRSDWPRLKQRRRRPARCACAKPATFKRIHHACRTPPRSAGGGGCRQCLQE